MTESSSPATTLRSERGPHKATAVRPGLAVGTSVGRYVVLGVAGEGGFGAVYRAYDPELDRKLALKVLDERGNDDPAVRKVVLSEARSLAKLRHPNIVSVYDVGEFEERGFVAMEYVDGQDLGAWLRAEPRPWPVVARVMAQAARGLAAAHDAGIVHRDFKPNNVLVDGDGGAFVVDFGLARQVRRDLDAVDEAASGSTLPPGTPRYLAPELYDGLEAGARSDVFSFCVSLWEAGVGTPPWVADDEEGLLRAKRAGPPALPKGTGIPGPVADLLRAGLSAEPAQRPGRVAALADALVADPGRRRWGVLALAGLAGVAGAGLWLRGSAPCAEAGRSLQVVWNDAVRADVAALFTAGDRPHAAEGAERLAANVDAWRDRWLAERRDACEATHVRHEQSAALLDRRIGCLDRELSQLSTLLDLVRAGDAELIGRAPRAVAKLSRGLSCDAASLRAASEDPSGVEAEAVIADLDRAQVLEAVAQYDTGLALARDVEARAEALGAGGLRLRAKYRRGRLLDLTGDAAAAVVVQEQVHWDAEAEGWDDVAANAGLDVMYEYGAVLGKPEVALSWAPHVRAAIRRAGDDARRRASLIDATGIAHLYHHEVEAARDDHEAALKLRESYDNDGLDTVTTLQNLGIVYEELHRYEDAIALHERALAILTRIVGEHHPHTARVVDNMGTALLRKGDVEAARERFQRALQVRRSVLSPKHRSIALSTVHLAHASLSAGDTNAAIEGFKESLALYQDLAEPGSRDILICHEALAHAYQAAGDLKAAKEQARIAYDGLSPSLPPEHPELQGLQAILDAAPAP
ncbi:MAG: serine/threonine-protein kinase [Myxococcota bacterium]